MCGRFPFHSNSALKLEELVLKGELTFPEIEWINVGDVGKSSPLALRGMHQDSMMSRFVNERAELCSKPDSGFTYVGTLSSLYTYVCDCLFDSDFSIAAKALIRNMLCVDTTSRFTARRVLDDPWFTVSLQISPPPPPPSPSFPMNTLY